MPVVPRLVARSMTRPGQRVPSIDDVSLAADLLRELAPHVGDNEEVSAVLRRWLAALGSRRFAFICTAALRHTFTDCLSVVPAADVPPGANTFNAPTTKELSG